MISVASYAKPKLQLPPTHPSSFLRLSDFHIRTTKPTIHSSIKLVALSLSWHYGSIARPEVTFPTVEHHRRLASTESCCLVTETHANNLPRVVTWQWNGRELHLQHLDCKSDALTTIRHQAAITSNATFCSTGDSECHHLAYLLKAHITTTGRAAHHRVSRISFLIHFLSLIRLFGHLILHTSCQYCSFFHPRNSNHPSLSFHSGLKTHKSFRRQTATIHQIVFTLSHVFLLLFPITFHSVLSR